MHSLVGGCVWKSRKLVAGFVIGGFFLLYGDAVAAPAALALLQQAELGTASDRRHVKAVDHEDVKGTGQSIPALVSVS